jgi:hypothetical protein
VGAAAIGIRNALGWTVAVAGLRSEKLVPLDGELARSSRGGKSRAKKLRSYAEHWRELGKGYMAENSGLTRQAAAENVLNGLTGSEYRQQFFTHKERHDENADLTERDRKERRKRAFRRIYLSLGPLFSKKKSGAVAGRRRP